MDKNYPIKGLLTAIKNVSLILKDIDNGYEVGLSIPIESLSKQDVELINEHLPGETLYNQHIVWIADNKKNKILFDNKDVAKETGNGQAPHLEKKLLFSIFRKTGIAFVPEKESVIMFVNKINKGD